MNKKEYQENIEYLQEHDVKYNGLAWDNKEFSAELEYYTDAGGDMLINLEELSKEELNKYLDDFDINEEVMLWWSETTSFQRSERGLPFSNIKEHYEDLEEWVCDLRGICSGIPH